MITIGLNELPEALRTVGKHGAVLAVTDHGAVGARLVLVQPAYPVRPGLPADLAALDALADRSSAAWTRDWSAPEAVSAAALPMAVVDASVLVAVLQRQDPFHQVRRVWFEAYLQVGGQLAAPLFVMSEVAMDVRARSSASRQASVPARWPLS